VAVRPVYAPALVAFVGGPRFSLAVGFGGGVAGVAWFPLGPREVYVPSYGASAVYINRVNVTNTTMVNNITVTNVNTTNIRYVNREAPGAVTAVPQNAFASARPVQGVAVPVRAEALQSAQVMNTAPVAPSRASVVGSYAGARVAQPPASVQSRSVVTRTVPPPAPLPFAQRQQALAANPGRPLDSAQAQQLRATPSQPAAGQFRPAGGPAPAANGWNREGTRPAVTQAPAQSQPARMASPNNAPARPTPSNTPARVEHPAQAQRPVPREQKKEERKDKERDK
jgi:hypothetical protein